MLLTSVTLYWHELYIMVFKYLDIGCILVSSLNLKKKIKSSSTALKQTACYICIFVNMERVFLMPCFLGEEKLYRSMTKRFRNMNMNWQGPMLWMWRITMVIYWSRKKKNRSRKKMNRASARASLCNNSECDTGWKDSKGKTSVEVKPVTDLISWSQWCNDTNILVSRYSVSSSPLSTPRSLPHRYSIIQHNGNGSSGIRCHGLTHLAPSLQYAI